MKNQAIKIYESGIKFLVQYIFDYAVLLMRTVENELRQDFTKILNLANSSHYFYKKFDKILIYAN